MSATEHDRETVAAILREHNCEDLAESPMAARIAEALAAARRTGDADTERLEFMFRNPVHVAYSQDGDDCWLHWSYDRQDEERDPWNGPIFDSPRAAIDAARKDGAA